jgi:hypothetical protein
MIDIETLSENDFQEILGIKRPTFYKLLETLEYVNAKEKRQKGHPNYKLTVIQKLVITLIYLREYPSMKSLSVKYKVSKNAIWKSIHWVENILIKADFLHIDGKKALFDPESEIGAVLIECDGM